MNVVVVLSDAQDYPRLVSAQDQRDSAALEALVRDAFARRMAEWVALPPNPDVARRGRTPRVPACPRVPRRVTSGPSGVVG